MSRHNPSRRERLGRAHGFTLIELMVVIVILGLLVGIVGPGVQRYLVDGKIATAKQQMANLNQAIQSFQLSKRRLPENLSELTGPDGFLQGDEVPKDPWGNEYVYERKDRKTFDLICLGGNGEVGGDDREDRDIHIKDLSKHTDDEE